MMAHTLHDHADAQGPRHAGAAHCILLVQHGLRPPVLRANAARSPTRSRVGWRLRRHKLLD